MEPKNYKYSIKKVIADIEKRRIKAKQKKEILDNIVLDDSLCIIDFKYFNLISSSKTINEVDVYSDIEGFRINYEITKNTFKHLLLSGDNPNKITSDIQACKYYLTDRIYDEIYANQSNELTISKIGSYILFYPQEDGSYLIDGCLKIKFKKK